MIKRFLILFSVILFMACKLSNEPDNFIYISPDIFLVQNPDDETENYLIINQNAIFEVHYDFIFPVVDDIEVSIEFSNNNLFELIDYNSENKTFTVLAKNKGNGRISVISENYHSSTSLPIIVF